MVQSYYETMWANNLGAGLVRHLTLYYGAAADNAEKGSIIAQKCLRSKILSLWIKNSLTNDAKFKLRSFKNSHITTTKTMEPQ